MEILCFYAGMAFLYLHHTYALLFLGVALFFRLKPAYVFWFILAIVWGCCHQWWVAEQGMPQNPVIKNALLQGYIASIPVPSDHKTQFYFKITQLNGRDVEANALLSCYQQCPEFHAGELWQLTATLKRPKNLGNPGHFDFVSWMDARHLGWTGYIKKKNSQFLSKSNIKFVVLSFREHLANKLAGLNLSTSGLGVLEALSLGVTSYLTQDEWQLFRHTGTTHLMIISGAHIGLVAGLSYVFIRWAWSFFGQLCLFIPAQRAAGALAFFLALIYALLAGFNIPAQRALIVCFFLLLRFFTYRRFSVWQAWRYALLSVLIFEPHSVLMPGFYLSFIAVAILLMTSQRFPGKGLIQMCKIQFACVAGLMPLTLFWFSYGAFNGMLANLLAIPLVGYIIMPLALLITLTCLWFEIPHLTFFLDQSIHVLLNFLNWLDSFSAWNLTVGFPGILSPIALMIAIVFVVFLPNQYNRLPLFLMAVSAIFPYVDKISPGEVHIETLDVGQGLAVVIRTSAHTMLYDTGLKFYKGGDMGQLAVIPYLDRQRIKKLDAVIISHADIDHRGGLPSIENKFPVQTLIVDNPDFYHRGLSCHHYPAWNWDGVAFRFFTIDDTLPGKNNHSCVLQVQAKTGKMLLSGDIEKGAERYLVKTYGKQLQSDVLLVPHHGSKTSSSPIFLKHVNPKYAIASYGFANRYHFPHHKVMTEYAKKHIEVYDTVHCGMASVRFTQHGLLPVNCFNHT